MQRGIFTYFSLDVSILFWSKSRSVFPYISSNVNEGGDDGGGSPMTAHLIDTSESAGNSRRFSLCGLMLKLNKSNLSSPKI